jgi:hypothetical protein
MPALRGLRQEDHEFEASLSYTVEILSQKKEKTKKKKVILKI